MPQTKRFFRVIDELQSTIDKRAKSKDPGSSYTAKLLARGPQQCAKKIGEEGVELALAIANESEAEIAAEAADVLYHILVGLKSRDVSLSKVAAALEKRQGMSGLEEKASRKK